MGIPDRVHKALELIAQGAARANRNPEEITLVAVSKNAGWQDIMEAYGAGLRHFGENRLQEAQEKIPLCPPDICWHFIGRLQTNKAKGVLEHFSLIHSLDRFKLAERLSRLAEEEGKTAKVLVQVNIAGEASKQGLEPGEVEGFIREVKGLPFLTVSGLMAMAPYTPRPEEARPYFKAMKTLFDHLRSRGEDLPYLSMGMSSDFQVAVEEGANMVRIGSLIFSAELID